MNKLIGYLLFNIPLAPIELRMPEAGIGLLMTTYRKFKEEVCKDITSNLSLEGFRIEAIPVKEIMGEGSGIEAIAKIYVENNGYETKEEKEVILKSFRNRIFNEYEIMPKQPIILK